MIIKRSIKELEYENVPLRIITEHGNTGTINYETLRN